MKQNGLIPIKTKENLPKNLSRTMNSIHSSLGNNTNLYLLNNLKCLN